MVRGSVRDGAGSGREDQQRPASARAIDELTRLGSASYTVVVACDHAPGKSCGSEGPGWAGAEVLKNTRFQMKDLFDKEGVPPLTSTKNGRLRRRDNCELTPLARHNRTVLKGPHRQGLVLKVWGECVHGLARAGARVLASVEAHVHARGLVGGIAKATACDRNRPLHKARTISITWLRRRVGFFLSFFLAGFFLVGIFFVEVFFFRRTRRVATKQVNGYRARHIFLEVHSAGERGGGVDGLD